MTTYWIELSLFSEQPLKQYKRIVLNANAPFERKPFSKMLITYLRDKRLLAYPDGKAVVGKIPIFIKNKNKQQHKSIAKHGISSKMGFHFWYV